MKPTHKISRGALDFMLRTMVWCAQWIWANSLQLSLDGWFERRFSFLGNDSRWPPCPPDWALPSPWSQHSWHPSVSARCVSKVVSPLSWLTQHQFLGMPNARQSTLNIPRRESAGPAEPERGTAPASRWASSGSSLRRRPSTAQERLRGQLHSRVTNSQLKGRGGLHLESRWNALS